MVGCKNPVEREDYTGSCEQKMRQVMDYLNIGRMKEGIVIKINRVPNFGELGSVIVMGHVKEDGTAQISC